MSGSRPGYSVALDKHKKPSIDTNMERIRLLCASKSTFAAVLLGLSFLPRGAVPQTPLIDTAVLVVSRGSNVIGREEFSIHRGLQSEVGAAFVGAGFTVSASAYYPSSRSYASTSSLVTFRADSQPTGAQMDLDGSGQPNTFVDFTARRVTVRNRTSRGESAGQYPRSDRMLLLDESILSLFALLPGAHGGTVTLFYPRTGLSSRETLADLGIERTTIDGDERQLRHFTIGSEERIRHIWFDSRGHLIKIEVPSADLVAIRSSRL